MAKRIISFSLYGTDEFYLKAAIPVVKDVHQVFPGYVPRMYVSQEIEEGLMTRLEDMGAEIIPKERKDGIDAMFWRFLAAADPEAELVMIRDIDSRMGKRDQQAHEAWLASGKDYHIVRDHSTQMAEMLGGLWACKGKKIPHIAQLIEKWKLKHNRGDDQSFLAAKIYPWMRHLAFIQTDVYMFFGEEVHPCPPFTHEASVRIRGMGYSEQHWVSLSAYHTEHSKKGKYMKKLPYCFFHFFFPPLRVVYLLNSLRNIELSRPPWSMPFQRLNYYFWILLRKCIRKIEPYYRRWAYSLLKYALFRRLARIEYRLSERRTKKKSWLSG